MDETVLTLKEAAEFLKISPRTISDLKSRNKIPFHKIGGKVIFLKSELVEWLKNS